MIKTELAIQLLSVHMVLIGLQKLGIILPTSGDHRIDKPHFSAGNHVFSRPEIYLIIRMLKRTVVKYGWFKIKSEELYDTLHHAL